MNVVTTTTMVTDMVKEIGGDRVNVVGLMGPGVDPHLYKPASGDGLQVGEDAEGARLVLSGSIMPLPVCLGAGYDPALHKGGQPAGDEDDAEET